MGVGFSPDLQRTILGLQRAVARGAVKITTLRCNEHAGAADRLAVGGGHSPAEMSREFRFVGSRKGLRLLARRRRLCRHVRWGVVRPGCGEASSATAAPAIPAALGEAANRVADALPTPAAKSNITTHAALRPVVVILFLRGSISPAMRRSNSPRPPMMPTAAAIGRAFTNNSATCNRLSPYRTASRLASTTLSQTSSRTCRSSRLSACTGTIGQYNAAASACSSTIRWSPRSRCATSCSRTSRSSLSLATPNRRSGRMTAASPETDRQRCDRAARHEQQRNLARPQLGHDFLQQGLEGLILYRTR